MGTPSSHSPNFTESAQGDTGGGERLKLHGVWVAPTVQAHDDAAATLKAVSTQPRAGFIDAPRLPPVRSATTLLLSDADGRLYGVDTTGAKPQLRPHGGGGDHRVRRQNAKPADPSNRLQSSPAQASTASPVAAEQVDAPSFGEKMLQGAGQALAGKFATALFNGNGIGPSLLDAMNPGNVLSALGHEAIDGLGGMLMGSLMGSLFGQPDDSAPLGEQLAAKFAPQLLLQVQGKAMEMANQALTGHGVDAGDQIRTYFFGVQSKATTPVGLSQVPITAPDYVLVGRGGGGAGPHHAALRQGDVAIHPQCGVPSPFVNGHPTVIVNGRPAVGMGHTAVCAKCGQPIMALDLAPTVFMGVPPPPPAPPAPANNSAGKQMGDACVPDSPGSTSPGTEALSESDEGGIGRPLVCEPDGHGAATGTVQRPGSVPDWFKDLPGVTNIASPEQQGAGIENWSVLWGAIELGSPQEPGAGTLGTWWVPDKLFGFDMSPYFLTHDQVFDDDRTLSELPRILGAEATAFTAGLANRPDAGLLVLQLIYSAATGSAGISAGVRNSIEGKAPKVK